MTAPPPDPIRPPPPIRPLPATHQDAAQSLVSRQTVNSIPYKSRLLDVSPEGSDADLLRFSRAFLEELQKRGMPFFPHCYVRGNALQDELYRKGVTRAKAGQSPHNHGMAVDIVSYLKGWDLTHKQWAVVGLIGKEVARRCNIQVRWGGDFKSLYDPAHWELADWKARAKAD